MVNAYTVSILLACGLSRRCNVATVWFSSFVADDRGAVEGYDRAAALAGGGLILQAAIVQVQRVRRLQNSGL